MTACRLVCTSRVAWVFYQYFTVGTDSVLFCIQFREPELNLTTTKSKVYSSISINNIFPNVLKKENKKD
jgi:hypothetical protein